MESVLNLPNKPTPFTILGEDIGLDSCFKDIMRRSIQYWLFSCRKTDIFELLLEVEECWKSHNEYIAHVRGVTDHLNYKAIIKTAIRVHSELEEGQDKIDLGDKIGISLNSGKVGIFPCYFDYNMKI